MSPSTRHRDVAADSALQAAKETFMQAIQQGMEALIECGGYSRERATMILMRELQRVNSSGKKNKNSKKDASVKTLRPTDEEMFDAMRQYGLGMEEATRALIVSKTFQREVIDANTANGSSSVAREVKATTDTLVQAIQRLVSNISLNNLLYESDSSMDAASEDQEESMTIRSDLRVDPVSPSGAGLDLTTPVNTTSSTPSPPSTKKSPSLSGRKRKMEESSSDNNQETHQVQNKATTTSTQDSSMTDSSHATNVNKRPRADSVTEQVDAKITAILPAARASSPTARPKRPHRSTSSNALRDDEGDAVMRSEEPMVNVSSNAVEERE